MKARYSLIRSRLRNDHYSIVYSCIRSNEQALLPTSRFLGSCGPWSVFQRYASDYQEQARHFLFPPQTNKRVHNHRRISIFFSSRREKSVRKEKGRVENGERRRVARRSALIEGRSTDDRCFCDGLRER